MHTVYTHTGYTQIHIYHIKSTLDPWNRSIPGKSLQRLFSKIEKIYPPVYLPCFGGERFVLQTQLNLCAALP